jgi:ubiquinone/menaquinone biosynthesis C-methylase UbiE
MLPASSDPYRLAARWYDHVIEPLNRKLKAIALRFWPPVPSTTVLDVGCGTGTLLIAAARSEPGIETHGVDPAAAMIQRARRKATAAGVKASFEIGVVEELAFEDDSIDAVLSSLMLHHLPPTTLRAGLTEIRRVLKPGGRFVAVDFAGPGPLLHRLGRLFRGGGAHPDHAARVMQELAEVGFTDLSRGRLRPGFLFSVVARKPS